MRKVMLGLSLIVLLPLLGSCIHSAIYTARVETAHPAEGQRVLVNGSAVHVQTDGSSGPAVLMIHGASANSNEFDWSLSPLLANDHRVFMADRPGHGHSDRHAGSDELEVQAAQLAGAMDKLAPGEKMVVVGHSFGGAVALRFALDHPDKVSALVLLAPVSHDWGGGGVAWYNNWAGSPLIGPAFSQLVPIVGPNSAKQGVAGTFHPQSAPDGYYEKSGVPLLFRPKTFRANAQDVLNLQDELRAQSERYPEIKVPVVLYSGRKDTVIKPSLHSGRLNRQLENVTLVDLPETGHMPHHIHSADIAETIRQLASGEQPG